MQRRWSLSWASLRMLPPSHKGFSQLLFEPLPIQLPPILQMRTFSVAPAVQLSTVSSLPIFPAGCAVETGKNSTLALRTGTEERRAKTALLLEENRRGVGGRGGRDECAPFLNGFQRSTSSTLIYSMRRFPNLVYPLKAGRVYDYSHVIRQSSANTRYNVHQKYNVHHLPCNRRNVTRKRPRAALGRVEGDGQAGAGRCQRGQYCIAPPEDVRPFDSGPSHSIWVMIFFRCERSAEPRRSPRAAGTPFEGVKTSEPFAKPP
ncbi:hypothetical protein B0H11DRAFT_2197625 [Mycena galericulata]|nr:hypothetical protein B0H11DRAFT_2197625 [Mycena galericulata]